MVGGMLLLLGSFSNSHAAIAAAHHHLPVVTTAATTPELVQKATLHAVWLTHILGLLSLPSRLELNISSHKT